MTDQSDVARLDLIVSALLPRDEFDALLAEYRADNPGEEIDPEEFACFLHGVRACEVLAAESGLTPEEVWERQFDGRSWDVVLEFDGDGAVTVQLEFVDGDE